MSKRSAGIPWAGLIAFAIAMSTGTARADKKTDAFRELVVGAQTAASEASAEAVEVVAKLQKSAVDNAAIRKGMDEAQEKARIAQEQAYLGMVTGIAAGIAQMAGGVAAVGGAIPAAGAPAQLCNSPSGGIKPLVRDALEKAQATQAKTLASVQAQQRLVQQEKNAVRRADLVSQLKTLQSLDQRAISLAKNIRELDKAVAGLKPCS